MSFVSITRPFTERLMQIICIGVLCAVALGSRLLIAGSGGVNGGCAYPINVNGQVTWKACSGAALPMWYSSGSPLYSEGEVPCGTYGNHDCGMTVGPALSE